MKDLEAEIVSYSKLNMKNVAKGVTLDMATREPKLLRYSTVFHCYESLEATISYSLQYSTVFLYYTETVARKCGKRQQWKQTITL